MPARRDEVQGFAKNESIAWPWESDKQAAFNTAFHATKPGGSFWLTDVVIEPGTASAGSS